jgi:hypothetical protein
MKSSTATGLLIATFVSGSLIATAAHAADDERCLSTTEPLAGDLRKVTSRQVSTGKDVTNWHILPAEPVCVLIGSDTMRNVTDIQVVFNKSVKLKELNDNLGMPLGVKGRIEFPRDDSFTGSIVVMDAVIFRDLDDSGSVRRK